MENEHRARWSCPPETGQVRGGTTQYEILGEISSSALCEGKLVVVLKPDRELGEDGGSQRTARSLIPET
jgi:hypothetical protein